MISKLKPLYLIFILLVTFPLKAQFNGHNFRVGVNVVYTTSAKIYDNPNSSDPVLRNNFFGLSDIINPSIDFRYRLTDEIIVGLSSEYMKKTESNIKLTVFSGNITKSISVTDGYSLIPFELSVYYLIPFSTDKIKFLMGGGGGVYFGNHIRKFGSVETKKVDQKIAYGIQVAIAMEYLILENFALNLTMKFRDPQFKVRTKYSKTQLTYSGEEINLPGEAMETKVNIDGVTFMLGAAYYF